MEKKLIISQRRFKGDSSVVSVRLPNDLVKSVDDIAEKTGYCIYYFGIMQPSFRDFHLDDDNEYIVEVIDTWEMTISEIGRFKGKFRVPLGSRQYMAVRIRKAI